MQKVADAALWFALGEVCVQLTTVIGFSLLPSSLDDDADESKRRFLRNM